jgi:hypothetical protein
VMALTLKHLEIESGCEIEKAVAHFFHSSTRSWSSCSYQLTDFRHTD